MYIEREIYIILPRQWRARWRSYRSWRWRRCRRPWSARPTRPRWEPASCNGHTWPENIWKMVVDRTNTNILHFLRLSEKWWCIALIHFAYLRWSEGWWWIVQIYFVYFEVICEMVVDRTKELVKMMLGGMICTKERRTRQRHPCPLPSPRRQNWNWQEPLDISFYHPKKRI